VCFAGSLRYLTKLSTIYLFPEFRENSPITIWILLFC